MYHPNITALLLGGLAFLGLSHAQKNCFLLTEKSFARYCTPLTFKDTTGGSVQGLPTASDCQDACRGVVGDPSDWLIDFSTAADGAQHSMLYYHCGFAISQGKGTPHDAKIWLANQDLIAVYNGTLSRFGGLHGGKISAEGTMECDGLEVNWFIEDLYPWDK
ncbi:hypothetical protein F5Y14DRAFT_305613 [Nemania sp. NC0429]|nr:hypothetical protein F5Y14DRAFT_305613 [Nemania sp. NC0429]